MAEPTSDGRKSVVGRVRVVRTSRYASLAFRIQVRMANGVGVDWGKMMSETLNKCNPRELMA